MTVGFGIVAVTLVPAHAEISCGDDAQSHEAFDALIRHYEDKVIAAIWSIDSAIDDVHAEIARKVANDVFSGKWDIVCAEAARLFENMPVVDFSAAVRTSTFTKDLEFADISTIPTAELMVARNWDPYRAANLVDQPLFVQTTDLKRLTRQAALHALVPRRVYRTLWQEQDALVVKRGLSIIVITITLRKDGMFIPTKASLYKN